MDFSCSYSVLLSSHASASYVRMSIIFISNIFQITSMPIPLSYLFLVSINISCGVPCIVSLIRSIWDSKFPLLLMPIQWQRQIFNAKVPQRANGQSYMYVTEYQWRQQKTNMMILQLCKECRSKDFGSYFRFGDDNKINYMYSHNHHQING